MRWSPAVVFIFGLASYGQDSGKAPIRATLQAGAGAGSLVLPIAAAPATGDRIVISTDTSLLKITVVTPEGRRINSANAAASGANWSEIPSSAPIGSTDGGYTAIFGFQQPGTQGAYTIEFAAARALPRPAQVATWFVSDQGQYDQLVSQIADVRRLGPVSLNAAQRTRDLTWSFPADEGGTLIDIVVSDPTAKLRLTLPSGASVTSASAQGSGFEWKTVSSRDEFDPPGSMFGLSGFLLPRQGAHHVITLEKASKGNYAIRIEVSGAMTSEVEAVVLPIEKLFKEASAEIGKPPVLPNGTVLIEPVALPDGCFVGDQLNLALRLAGDPISAPVRFRVQVETRAPLPHNGPGPQEYAAPKVAVTPVTFTRSSDGWYRGILVPKQRGIMRVSIQASGTTGAGMAFTQDTVLPQVMVSAVAARLVSLTEHTVDDNGNGRPDRLELTATLDVAIGGKYGLRFMLSKDNAIGALGDGSATLAARQKVTASVPAARIFKSLRDGPYRITGIQIFKEEGSAFEGVKGATPTLSLTTAAYKRDDWDRGENFGEEKIEVRPLRPDTNGKFTAVEVLWGAVTEGGWCSASGDLDVDKQRLHVIESGELPKRRSLISLEFDARPLANASKASGYFSGIVNCGNGEKGAATAFLPVTVDPSQFERDDSPLRVFSQSMIRVVVGKTPRPAFAALEVAGKQQRDVVYRVTSVPTGLAVVLRRANLQVTANDEVAPGRYYIGVEANAGTEHDSGEVVVDAVRELPAGPARKYDSTIATARGVRPNKSGKFQNLEVLWPVNIVPAGDCSWDGNILSSGAPVMSAGMSGRLPDGKSSLSFIFDGGAIGNSRMTSWTFRGRMACSNPGRAFQLDSGISRDSELTLHPSGFAKRPGLPLNAGLMQIVGSYSFTELNVKSATPEPAVFMVGDLPPGFQASIDRPYVIAGMKTARLKVAIDPAVKPGLYFVPIKVAVGAEQGTTDLIVEVSRP